MADTQPLAPTDAELTAIYKAVNCEDTGKAQPLTTQHIFRAMRAAIAKWGAQPVVPAGYALVPVEPTDAMVQAAHHLDLSYMPGHEGADRAAIYRAMLAAAPQTTGIRYSQTPNAQPVAREPLTAEQIEAICADLRDTVGCSDKTLARAIECAHGIT